MTQTFADGFGALSLGEGGTWDSNFWWGAENGSTMESQSSWYIDTDYGPTQSLNPFSVADGVMSITAQTVPADLQPSINGYDFARSEEHKPELQSLMCISYAVISL